MSAAQIAAHYQATLGPPGASSTATGVVAAAAPVNTTPPSISGSAVVGAVVTADQGSWTGTPPISYARQWRRCDASGNSCVDIPGETATTYTIQPADAA